MKKQHNFVKQDPADGLLEIVSFSKYFSMGITKKGYRMIQDEGPIEFKFKDSNIANGDSFTYLNIDGEFYKMKNPDTVKI